jgi:hypothetical protein
MKPNHYSAGGPYEQTLDMTYIEHTNTEELCPSVSYTFHISNYISTKFGTEGPM